MRKGELKFILHGRRLGGRFTIVRTDTDDASQERWLLLKKRDEFAVDGWDAEDYPAA